MARSFSTSTMPDMPQVPPVVHEPVVRPDPPPPVKRFDYIRRDTHLFDQVDRFGTRKAAFNEQADYEPPGQQKPPKPGDRDDVSTPLKQVRGKAADKEESMYISLSELGPGETSPPQYGTHKLRFSMPELTHDKLMKALSSSTDRFADETAKFTKGGDWIPSQQGDKAYAELADKLGIPKDTPISEKQRAMLYSAHDREALAEGTQTYGSQVQLLMHVKLPTSAKAVEKLLAEYGKGLPPSVVPEPDGTLDYTKFSKLAQVDPHLVDKGAYFVPLTKDETVHFRSMVQAKGAFEPSTPEIRAVLAQYGQPGPKDRVTLNEVESVLNTKDLPPDQSKLLEKESSMLARREQGISVSQMPEKGHYQQRGVVTEIDRENGTMYMDIGRKHEVAVPLSALDKVPAVRSEVALDIRDGKGTVTPVQVHARSQSVEL
jgi:hypothetical protein